MALRALLGTGAAHRDSSLASDTFALSDSRKFSKQMKTIIYQRQAGMAWGQHCVPCDYHRAAIASMRDRLAAFPGRYNNELLIYALELYDTHLHLHLSGAITKKLLEESELNMAAALAHRQRYTENKQA